MNSISKFLIIPIVLITFACKGNDAKQADAALNNDLSLAAQAHPATPAESLSAAERTGRPATTAHHRGYSSTSSGTSSPVARASHVEKHGGRDAAIGAGAGAILGAATSKDKVKGGIIGAAAGGILGAVIGNNVDKKTVPNH
jgi:hypothetical protein